MTAIRLQAARELLQNNHFDAARAVLKTMLTDPTATRWLEELEKIAPTKVEKPELTLWEHCQIYWDLAGFSSLSEEHSDDVAFAVTHRFVLRMRTFLPLVNETSLSGMSQDILQRTTDLRKLSEENLDQFSDFETVNGLRQILLREYSEQSEYSVQYRLFAELHNYLRNVAETYVAWLGLEGWQLVTVMDTEPWYWTEVNQRFRDGLTTARLVYYLKHPITQATRP